MVYAKRVQRSRQSVVHMSCLAVSPGLIPLFSGNMKWKRKHVTKCVRRPKTLVRQRASSGEPSLCWLRLLSTRLLPSIAIHDGKRDQRQLLCFVAVCTDKTLSKVNCCCSILDGREVWVNERLVCARCKGGIKQKCESGLSRFVCFFFYLKLRLIYSV